MKNQKGITLIALIITIIVMLILVAVTVTIAMDGGIFTKSKDAATKTQINADKETLNAMISSAYNGITGEIENSDLTASLKNNDWTVEGTGPWTCTSPKENVFTVTKQGKITEGKTEVTCFAKGTKITMSDGSTKNIEDIKLGDYVLTFNHEKGIFESQEVYVAWKGKELESAFTLHFDNEESISIVGEHDLFEKENLKYVMITEENAESFIGKHFYSVTESKYLELISVTKENEKTEYYSIYTKFNENSIANGMLSVPDDVDFKLNMYDFNENLSINYEQLKLDIQKYGLFEYSNAEGCTKEEYDFMNMRYLNIMVGKKLVTWEELYSLREEYLNCN